LPELVIAMYKPKPGKEKELLDCLKDHVPTLRQLGLATGREAVIARSRKDGTVLEVFEWVSAQAVEDAHSNSAVQEFWERLSRCAEYRNLSSLVEADEFFPHFEPIQ